MNLVLTTMLFLMASRMRFVPLVQGFSSLLSSSSLSSSSSSLSFVQRTLTSSTLTSMGKDSGSCCCCSRITTRVGMSTATTTSTTTTTTTTTTTANGEEETTSNQQQQKQSKNNKTKLRRVLSGVQPTGSLHLGNYLGAIRQWVDFQNEPDLIQETTEEDGTVTTTTIKTENFFCVVDLHAITMPHDPQELSESTLTSAALYLAAGIDPKKSKVFVQSHVPAHSELAWLLNCITPMNWLERMIQFKDKSKKQQQQGGGGSGEGSVGVGLFTYPALMAADILLYQADRVPVGEDQRQHLELARDTVRRFHDLFCKGNTYKKRCKKAGISSRPVFVEPEAMIVKDGGAHRVMSLTDGTSKMSKSDPNDDSRINILDPPDIIRKKIKSCKTDAIVGLEWDNPNRPEATNLLNIYWAVQQPSCHENNNNNYNTDNNKDGTTTTTTTTTIEQRKVTTKKTRQDILDEVGTMTWGEFKPVLAQAIIDHLQPIQERYYAVRKDENQLIEILQDGAQSARQVADQTLHTARVAMGFVTTKKPTTTPTTTTTTSPPPTSTTTTATADADTAASTTTSTLSSTSSSNE